VVLAHVSEVAIHRGSGGIHDTLGKDMNRSHAGLPTTFQTGTGSRPGSTPHSSIQLRQDPLRHRHCRGIAVQHGGEGAHPRPEALPLTSPQENTISFTTLDGIAPRPAGKTSS
jgi:hypothetical protein